MAKSLGKSATKPAQQDKIKVEALKSWVVGESASALGEQLNLLRKDERFGGSENDVIALQESLAGAGADSTVFDKTCQAIVLDHKE